MTEVDKQLDGVQANRIVLPIMTDIVGPGGQQLFSDRLKTVNDESTSLSSTTEQNFRFGGRGKRDLFAAKHQGFKTKLVQGILSVQEIEKQLEKHGKIKKHKKEKKKHKKKKGS